MYTYLVVVLHIGNFFIKRHWWQIMQHLAFNSIESNSPTTCMASGSLFMLHTEYVATMY